MNSQESSSTGFTPPTSCSDGGHPAWVCKGPCPKDYKIPVGDWLEHKEDLATLASATNNHVPERELTKRNRPTPPATFRVGARVSTSTSKCPHGPATVCRTPSLGPIAL